MGPALAEWKLSDAEWEKLGGILARDMPATRGPGKPRLDNDRQAAEACLFRHYHQLARVYNAFGWNELPEVLGITPSTANRRFREWTADGRWARFWDALMRIRRGEKDAAIPPNDNREWGEFPGGDLISELERAYRFFNEHFFARNLPGVVLTVERFLGRRDHPPQGLFCPRQWHLGERSVGQIALCADILGDGAERALRVLLHEMVHLRNDQAGLTDCTPPHSYHNRFFRDAAHLAGLKCPARDLRRGYAETRLGPRARKAISQLRPREDLFVWQVGPGSGWG